MVEKIKSIIIWDAPNPPPNEKCDVILWRELLRDGLPKNYISIPELVEKNSLYLRNQYLAWIYDLGKYEFHYGKTVIEYLLLKNGLSFWWMTELSEKCNHSKSMHIDDALYLKAFENWAFPRNTKEIVMVSSNRNLIACLKQWCSDKNVVFKLIAPSKSLFIKPNLFKVIPYFLKAVISLAWYLWQRWPLRGLGLNEWIESNRSMTIVSYFLNMNQALLQNGTLESKYWGPLPKILNQSTKGLNWFHFYNKSNEIPTVKYLKNKIKILNNCATSEDIHVVAESFLNIQIIFNAIKEWRIIRRKCLNIEGIFSKVYFGGFNLEPLYISDWKKYCYGSGSLHTILNLNLLSQAFSILQRQDYGIYLQENQNWEFGFIRVWKDNNHGNLIGFPHSTVRFWDLRYFMDRRIYGDKGLFELPLPDVVGVNGPHALDLFIESGFPRERMVKVESLRYLHLNRGAINSKKYSRLPNEEISILVITDIVYKQAFLQLKLLEKAVKLLNYRVKVLLKPHPGSRFMANEFPDLNIHISREPIADLVAECHIAYAGNMSTAALDVCLSGSPLLIFYDPKIPNYSALRGNKSVLFVSKPEDIIKGINLCKNSAVEIINSDEYFHLDGDLKLWKSLLNIPNRAIASKV